MDVRNPNIDEYLKELVSNTKGNYITQGVAFNKNCKRQMALLKLALEDSASFSGLVKEMLALRYTKGSPKPATTATGGFIVSNTVSEVDVKKAAKEAWVS